MAVKIKFEMVKSDDVFFDYARNVRMDGRYDTDPIDPKKLASGAAPGLYEDIFENGVQTPLAVAKLTTEEAERLREKHGLLKAPKYRGIRGHRRGRVVQKIRETHPHMLEVIPANVYEGLTVEDEIRLLVDQVHVQNLNDFELYLAVKALVLAGLTEEGIAKQMGKSRTWVQRRKWIAQMPEYVEAEFAKRAAKVEGQSYITITDPMLNDLNKAANIDRANGVYDLDRPGTEFRKEWDKITAADGGEGKGRPAKSLTRKEIQDRMMLVRDPIIKAVMQWASGDPINLGDILDQMASLRSKVGTIVAEGTTRPIGETV